MFCFWCESGKIPKNLREKGFVWIHLKCIIEISNLKQDIDSLKKILSNEKDETITSFLERMTNFDDHHKKIMKQLGLL